MLRKTSLMIDGLLVIVGIVVFFGATGVIW
jgi:hypothetical protein